MRKIRIFADTDNATALHISDAATGEPLDNVVRVDVTCTPVGFIRAQLTVIRRGAEVPAVREIVQDAPIEMDVVARLDAVKEKE